MNLLVLNPQGRLVDARVCDAPLRKGSPLFSRGTHNYIPLPEHRIPENNEGHFGESDLAAFLTGPIRTRVAL